MIAKIEALFREVEAAEASTTEQVEQYRVAMLGRKGKITLLFDEFKALTPDEKRELGAKINALKQRAMERHAELEQALPHQPASQINESDYTRSVNSCRFGTLHPLTLVEEEINRIFHSIGFFIAQGPELEDDWHVFSALNFPPDHPARDMQDTFFVEEGQNILLRTHTSSVQVRMMEAQRPPIRVVCPGRVFRNEDISARAHCQFHQVEGLYIDRGVSFAHMKQTLLYFAREMFGQETEIRLRPSYFPFTEPSAEVDVSCNLCHGKGCNVCKHTGWLEILGCGMVDPNVLCACNIDPHEYSGYAFGMGVERIAMLKYQINDLRLFFENDLRFLEQFHGGY